MSINKEVPMVQVLFSCMRTVNMHGERRFALVGVVLDHVTMQVLDHVYIGRSSIRSCPFDLLLFLFC